MQIERTILNFSKKGYNSGYSKKKSNEQSTRTSQLMTHADIQASNKTDMIDILVCGMNRCYVEDFIEINVGENVLMLFEKTAENPFRKLTKFIGETKPHVVSGYRKKWTYIRGIVSSCPNRQSAIGGMIIPDLQRGLGYENYGSNINVMVSENENVHILVTWNMVVKSTVQVWKKIDVLRDPLNIFHNKRKNKAALRNLLNKISPEVAGDRLQSMILLGAYHRALLKNHEVSSEDKTSNETLVKSIRQQLYEKEALTQFIVEADRVFKVTMKKCYCDFTVIAEPLVSENEIKKLIMIYKTRLPNHYEVMAEFYNFSHRMRKIRNVHLLHTGFYDRKIFFEFLSQIRVANNQKLIHWAICQTAAGYAVGSNISTSLSLSYFGATATYKSFLRRTKIPRDSFITNIKQLYQKQLKSCCMLDNNQKGHPIQFQRYGSSNKFVKVTGIAMREYIYHA